MELDKRKIIGSVSTSIIYMLLIQAATILIWATQLDARVNEIEQQVYSNRNLSERFAKLEERLDDVKQGMVDIKQELKAITQQLMRP